jgi:hypothetical protein
MDVSEYSVAPAQGLAGEVRSIFPTLAANFFGAGRYGSPEFFVTSAIPRSDNGWVGNNRGGWSNPEFDRLNDLLNATLDQESQAGILADLWTVVSGGPWRAADLLQHQRESPRDRFAQPVDDDVLESAPVGVEGGKLALAGTRFDRRTDPLSPTLPRQGPGGRE